jgi:signal transduction histidine kinase
MADLILVFTYLLPTVAWVCGVVFFLIKRGTSAFFRDRYADAETFAMLVLAFGFGAGTYGAIREEPGLTSVGMLVASIGFGFHVIFGAVLLTRLQVRERAADELGLTSESTTRRIESMFLASDAAGVATVLLGPGAAGDDTVTRCSQSGAQLLGSTVDQVVGQPFSSFIAPEDRALFSKLAQDSTGPSDRGVSASLNLSGPRNERLPVDVGLTSAGEPNGLTMAVFLVDARPKRSAIAAAREARTDAEFYLDLVTHDLSNFNQGALGYLQLYDMSKGGPQEKLDRFHQNAFEQIQNCSRLIENVKLLSIIRDSREPLASVDALHALHDAMDRVVSTQKTKHVEVRLVPMTTATKVRADHWLGHLFLHIVDNAAKYTSGPRVEVAISVSEGLEGKSLIFRVADRGRGISVAEREVILDRIASRQREMSAYRSGVGLFIVKTVADRYGARLWIEDRVPGEPTKGSVFCVELPAP